MGAQHIVKLCQQFAPPDEEDSDADDEPPGQMFGDLDLGATQGFFLMEELRRGSLAKMVENVADERIKISNRTVWLIFEKLYRMVVATRYPVQWWSDFDVSNVVEREETIPTPAQTLHGPARVNSHG